MEKCIGGCLELERLIPELSAVGCCNSCHEDTEEYGYSLQYIDTDKGYYEVCCKMKEAYMEFKLTKPEARGNDE